jgi:hypothetical protein
MLVDDYIQEEKMMEYDSDNPTMPLGTIYPCMEKIRLAVRQYSIIKEFELGVVEATSKSRYRGYCKGGAWSIVGFKKGNITVMVLN